MLFLLRSITCQTNHVIWLRNCCDPSLIRLFSASLSSSSLEVEFENVRKSSHMHKYLQLSQFQKLLDNVKIVGDISSVQALRLLHSCGNFLVFEDAQSRRQLTNNVWKLIMELDTPLDESHFQSLIEAYIDNDAVVTTNEFFALMASKHVKASSAIYSRLIYYFCKHGNAEECLKLLEMMQEDKIPIGTDIYRYIFIGSVRASDKDKVNNVTSVINENKVLLKTGTILNSMVKIYSELNNLTEVKSILGSVREMGKEVNPKYIFEAYVQFKSHQNQQAVNWLEPMIPHNQPIYVAAPYVLRLTKLGEYEAAGKLVDISDAPQNFQRYFLPLLVKYAPLAVTLAHCHKLRTTAVMPKSYAKLLRILANEANVRDTLTVLRVMKGDLLPTPPKLLYPIIDSLDPLQPSLFDDLLHILQFDDGSSGILYSDHVLPLLDMTDPVKTYRALVSNLYEFNYIHYGCVKYLLDKRDIVQTVKFLKATSGLKRCFAHTQRAMGMAFAHNVHLTDEMAQLVVYLDTFFTKLEHKKNIKTELFGKFLNTINLELRIAKVSNTDEVMLQLLETMYKVGINISETNMNCLVRLRTFKDPKAMELLQQMQTSISDRDL